jgi:C4-type Zn-finger protein
VSSVYLERKGTDMPLIFVVDTTCPTCGNTIRHAVIDLHPTVRGAAIHSLKCTDCGYEKTKVLSLRRGAPPAELRASKRPPTDGRRMAR